MQDDPSSPLVLPDGRVITPRLTVGRDGTPRVAGLMSRREWEQLRAIEQSEYFIFKNDGGALGERLKCRWHTKDPATGLDDPFSAPVFHMYFSYMCQPLPFRGLKNGLWVMSRYATEEYKADILKASTGIPELALGHPNTARDWLGTSLADETVAGILLALPEPITREQALHFIDRINEQRPPIRITLANLPGS